MKNEVIYRVEVFTNEKIIKQMEWAEESAKKKTDHCVFISRGQFFRYKRSKESTETYMAVCLEDSSKDSNNCIACPVCLDDGPNPIEGGIPIGRVLAAQIGFDAMAMFTKIARIHKNFIVLDELFFVKKLILPEIKVERILNYYAEFLRNLSTKYRFDDHCHSC
ncbi:MAG: hypothetical protein SOV26_05425 [Candidatus Onthovivens sp.]|nr:hypothetical protein [Candidatus Onthovivens sp.]